ncbi:hypothetical protein ACYZX9_18465 [Sphingomonas citri]
MLHAFDRATFAHLLTLDLDPTLRGLLSERIAALSDDLLDQTEIVVIEPGDTEEDLVRAIGLSPLVEPVDGARYGGAGFWPHWDWLSVRDGWFEMVITFGSTFAYVLLLEDAEASASDMVRLCRSYVSAKPR